MILISVKEKGKVIEITNTIKKGYKYHVIGKIMLKSQLIINRRVGGVEDSKWEPH